MTHLTASTRIQNRAMVHRYSLREVLVLTVLGVAAVAISLTIAFLDPATALAVPDHVLDTAR